MDERAPGRVPQNGVIYRFESYELDTARREVRRAGAVLECPPKVYELLVYLLDRSERAVSKGELGEALWGAEWGEGALRQCVSIARRIVPSADPERPVIRTMSGHGYSWGVPVVPLSAAGASVSEPLERKAPPPDSSPAFVGRQAELAELDRLLHLAIRGTPQLACVLGEAGAGKTRLLEEFAQLVRRRGVELLTGRVPQQNGVPPYWLWRDLLDPLIQNRPREQLEQEIRGDAAVLAELFPKLRERFPDLQPATLESAEGPYRLFGAIHRFITRAAETKPLVLLLEDVHWADPSSLLLLRSLAENRESRRVSMIAAFRTEDVPEDDPRTQLRRSIAEHRHVVAIHLGGLDASDTARLGELAAGRMLHPRWRTELPARTEGNPLMTIELVRLLDERGALDRTPEPRRALPSGARATIEHRLDLLSDRCLDTLTRASIFGRAFQFDLLAAICDADNEDVLRELEAATRSRVVEREPESNGYRFRHALLREALYARLEESTRVALHQRAAAALEERYRASRHAPLDALVYHFSQSPFPAHLQKAVEYAKRAADDALRMLAYPEAIELYERSLESLALIAPGDDRRVAPLLRGLALAQRGAGRHADAIETFGRLVVQARADGNSELFAQAAIGLEEARYTTRLSPESSIPLLEEGLRGLPRVPTRLRAQLLERIASASIVLNEPRRIELSREAVHAARELGDPLILVRALEARHLAIWGPDSLEERLAIGQELLELSQHTRAVDSFGVGAQVAGHTTRMSDLLEIGDLEGVVEAVEAGTFDLSARRISGDATGERIAEDARLQVHYHNVRMFRGALLILQGQFSQAETLVLDLAAEAMRLQAGNLLAGIHVQLWGLRSLQGRTAEIIPLIQMFLANNPGLAHGARAAFSASLAALCRFDEARVEIDRVAKDGLSRLPRDSVWVATLCLLADAAYLMQSPAYTEEIYKLLRPFEERIVLCSASHCLGSVARYLGQLATLLGALDTAAQHFETSLMRNRALKAAPFVAWTQYDFALMLLRQGSAVGALRAKALLSNASQAATALGMSHLAERIAWLEAGSPP